MKGLTRGQLEYLLNQLNKKDLEDLLLENQIHYLFKRYGDDYYREQGRDFQLTTENPKWDEGRGIFSWIPQNNN